MSWFGFCSAMNNNAPFIRQVLTSENAAELGCFSFSKEIRDNGITYVKCITPSELLICSKQNDRFSEFTLINDQCIFSSNAAKKTFEDLEALFEKAFKVCVCYEYIYE